jgi:deoxyribodipyrimidine photo-lyase
MKKALYWFRYDLRLQDNPGWAHVVASHDAAVGVYVLPERWFAQGRYHSKGLGQPRLQFILQALLDLREQLRGCGSDLVFQVGDAAQLIPQWVQSWNIGLLAVGKHPGSDEADDVTRVQQALDIPLHQFENFTLFERDDLPFSLEDLPLIFSQFRKKIEKCSVSKTVPVASALRQPFQLQNSPCELDQWLGTVRAKNLVQPPDSKTLPFYGGTRAAQQQLDYFLWQSHSVATYKETRNGFDGWDFSSKLSPWLAQGCISAREIAEALSRYENQYGANESSYWLYFELLWREYFQWLMFRFGKKLFALQGIQNKNPLLNFYPEKFNAWCTGTTTNDLVNACMRQLQQSGWMSNRGRQIAASYLINELGVDWRYGAAWFEEQLIDYDCAANWGNWQYLAGVGTDPRGRRHFNLEKQQQTYDPQHAFTMRWGNSPNDAQKRKK